MQLSASLPATAIPAAIPAAIDGSVYGVILNDRDSLARIASALPEAPYKGAPKAPVLYIKPANTLTGDGAVVNLPAGAGHLEIGATIGIVIGNPAARISPAHATAHIAGYVIVADLSLPHSSYYRPAIREKCFDDACVIGSHIAATGTVADPAVLEIVTLVNEREVSRRSLRDLVRNVPTLLTDVTEFMTLNRGDVLLTGVTWQAPLAGDGDRISIRVDGIGELNFSLTGKAAEQAA